ncbi:hypothetical protein LOK49_LG12G00851 [Camellia lanceoleosa]|uniref:Uncharacterized protein n=1 Tax=Camellia lanceoleosa TaxID=1840588 RepID=A0ACC0FRR3_9ERIC|nr:hypothetical protein LOK49_LG12G00851 [Camellia lanceoleosa]
MYMASDESVSMADLEDDCCDIDDGYHHHHQHQQTHHPHHLQTHPHNLSRLSMCSSSNSTTVCGQDDDGDGDGDPNNYFQLDDDDDDDDAANHHSIMMFMSRLSIESCLIDADADADADADEELSDEKEGKQLLSSDSDKEPTGCYSLPMTPPRRRNRNGGLNQQQVKEYASENEVHKDFLLHKKKMRRRRKRRIVRERWLNATGERNKKTVVVNMEEDTAAINMDVGCAGGVVWNHYNNNSNWGNSCGESEEGGGSAGGGRGLVVITRPKGGRRSLCMDLDEVKACRDLGFELEHKRTSLEIMPTRLSVSVAGSPLDTSSGGNSPISSWRISSPGDDPRDVKARLKVWAQAVALASTSRHSC